MQGMSNGCGCSKGVLKYFKPPYADEFYVPCCMHDDDYDKGGNDQDRKVADRLLFSRMVKLSLKLYTNPWKIVWLVLIALLYYSSVRLFGRSYFRYVEK